MSGKYVIMFYDGLGPYNPWPDAPSTDNTCASLTDARRMFRAWLTDSGNDYRRAEGYGQPWADVYRVADWDGISYGDMMSARFTRAMRGGIVRECV